MTATPDRQAFGVRDADLPMTVFCVRVPITWLKAIRTRALMDGSDPSKIVRAAIAMYADQADLNLNGY